jgi:hypothetical protein
MAYDFLGTIPSIEDFEEFEEFVNIEKENIQNRISHLRKEKLRFQELLSKFKRADSSLRSEYTLSKSVDENYLLKPRPIPNTQQNVSNALNAVDVDDLKKTFLPTIKFKRERNEFKIKRLRDLCEQKENEIAFLEEKSGQIDDLLNRIRTRFDLDDFVENQKVAELDSADLESGIKAINKGQGRNVVNGETFYLVLSINPANKSITFDSVAPPVQGGQKLELSEGNNNGEKTVVKFINEKTIQVSEALVEEFPTTSKARIVK